MQDISLKFTGMIIIMNDITEQWRLNKNRQQVGSVSTDVSAGSPPSSGRVLSFLVLTTFFWVAVFSLPRLVSGVPRRFCAAAF